MPYCGFCGKLCATVPGLNKHIDKSANCKKASEKEFGQYANSIWDNVPEKNDDMDDNMEQQPLPNLQIEPEDIHLEEDIQIAQEMIIEEENNLPPAPPPPQQNEPQPRPQCATVEDVPENEDITEGVRYIEHLPDEYLAGATWGKGKPLFDHLDEEQKREGGSRWGPFEDEDEWQLAEWLIENVGQKQTDRFLKLPIVSFLFSAFFSEC